MGDNDSSVPSPSPVFGRNSFDFFIFMGGINSHLEAFGCYASVSIPIKRLPFSGCFTSEGERGTTLHSFFFGGGHIMEVENQMREMFSASSSWFGRRRRRVENHAADQSSLLSRCVASPPPLHFVPRRLLYEFCMA